MKYCLITFTYDDGPGAKNRFGMESIPCTYVSPPSEIQIDLLGISRINSGSRHVIGHIIEEISEEEFLRYPKSMCHSFEWE